MEAKQQERIQKARELQRDGYFSREIKTRAVSDLFWDKVTLECGHDKRVMPRDDDTTKTFCLDCAEAWLEDDGTRT